MLEIISILPYSIPGIVLAIGVILSWSGAFGINLANTLWIILIAYIARYLAFSMKSASASLQQVHYSLEDAARTCGATHFESPTDVTLPLIRPAMISGFFLIFLPAMRGLTTSVPALWPVHPHARRSHLLPCAATAILWIPLRSRRWRLC